MQHIKLTIRFEAAMQTRAHMWRYAFQIVKAIKFVLVPDIGIILQSCKSTSLKTENVK